MPFSYLLKLALAAPVYSVPMLFWLFPRPRPLVPDLMTGLLSLWHPGMILFFEALWVTAFLYTGKSRVTASEIRFEVCRDRI